MTWLHGQSLTAYESAYLKPNHCLLSDLLTTRQRLVLEAMRDVPQDCRILEVGCSFGPILRALWDAGYHNLSGCDLDNRAIEKARHYVPEAELRQGNAELLPYEEGGQDVLVSTGVLNYLHDPQRAVSEMHRVLRPNGRLILSSANSLSLARVVLVLGALVRLRRPAPRKFRYYRCGQVLEMLAAAGFVDTECQYFCHVLPFGYRWPRESVKGRWMARLRETLRRGIGDWWGSEFLIRARRSS